MAKKTYRIKRKRYAPPLQAKNRKRFPKKKALILLLMTVLFFVIYQLALSFYWGIILDIYCTAAGLLLLFYIFMNRGLLSVPEKKKLPDDWDNKQKEAFLAEQTARKKRSEILLYFIIPILFTVLLDLFFIFLELNMGLKMPSV